ncbi:toll/interleukin-1 receptor domain-containing protein [Mucilaginibacter phyllosphaerae]
MHSQLILQMQLPDGRFSCEKFDNFPAPKSAYVAICYTNTLEAEQMATDLKAALINAIQNLGSVSSMPPCNGTSIGFDQCGALAVDDNTKLLIVVTDGLSCDFADPEVLNWTFDLLPVLKIGTPVTLPGRFGEQNAVFWKGTIDEVIPTLFGLTGISDIEQRIFISYRRSDASEFAIQLFNRLSQEGFEVFLDRFSINPGVNFQNRLYQELADKAMVLLIESAEYLESKWVQYEIDFAKKYRLGLFAANIGGSPKVQSLDDEFRHNVLLNTSKELDSADLDRLLVLIKQQHAIAIYRMRNYLSTNVNAALINKGASPTTEPNGFIIVSDMARANEYSIWTTARPPLVNDYHYSDISNSTGRTMFMVGPEFMEQRREVINNWLCGKAAVRFYNEGQLLDLCNEIYP